MTRNLLRWADPATVCAYFTLRDLAPQLSGLLYCAAMPEKPLAKLLDWSESVTEADPMPAFDLDRLQEVLPALTIAFVASHTYARQERSKGEGDVIDLYDAGCGTLVGEIMGLTGLIALTLHGDDGYVLVKAARADLAERLLSISELIRGR